MKKQNYGRFVNICSSIGMFGGYHNGHYATAKAGIFGLNNVIAIEGAPYSILANTILPTGHSRMVTDNTAGQNSEALQAFYAAIRPELITPIVIYLASRDCTLTHQNIAAFAGRYSRVFAGYAEGWLSEEGSTPNADDIAAHIEQITRTEKFTIPDSIVSEVFEICAQRGIQMG
jgi:NAD(P)-dependent dehydrogenase (short-subunit alcohol dehydrogenase family)